MLIYVDGDSFTAGVGLYDEFYIDNYRSLNNCISLEDFDKIKDEFSKKKNIDSTYIHHKEKERCWSSKLEKLLDCEVINAAYGGSSLEEIGDRTILNLLMLEQQNKKVDICFIGLTSTYRKLTIRKDWFYYDHDKIKYHYDWMYSLLSSFHNKPSTAGMERVNFIKSWVLLNNDETEIIMFLLEMLKIKLSVRALIGKDPIFLPIYHEIPKMLTDEMKSSKSIKHLIDFSGINEIDSRLEFSIIAKDQRLACHHFPESSHQDYAYVILNYLKEKKYVE